MELFEIRDGGVFPTAHSLLIHPFSEIWESDPDEKKGNATKVFKYIELVCSPRKTNPFRGYSEEERPSKVKKEVWGDENKQTTDYMIRGVAKYKELLLRYSPTYDLLIAALKARDALVDFLNSVDLSDTTESGAMKLKPKDVTSAMKEIPDVTKSIYLLFEKVEVELNESKTRNDREIGDYER